MQKYIGKIDQFIKSNLFLRLTLIWYVFQATYFAFVSRLGIPPDEFFHYGYIKYFSQFQATPIFDSQQAMSPVVYRGDSFFLGQITRATSYLYHYILGLVDNLLIGSNDVNNVIALRLINVVLAFAAVLLFVRLLRKLNLDKGTVNVATFMLCNTLMFVFLSGSINYDNAIFLITMASLNVIFSVTEKNFYRTLIGFVILMGVGVLIKISFVVLAIMMLAIFVYLNFKLIKSKLSNFKPSDVTKGTSKVVVILMGSLLAVVMLLAVERYLLNVVNYHVLTPKCDKILTVDQCMKNGIYKRTKQLSETPVNKPSLTPFWVFSGQWVNKMIDSTYGIMAHRNMEMLPLVHWYVRFFAILGAVAIVRKFKNTKEYRPVNLLLLMSFTYLAILLLSNYSTYNKFGVFGLALQGRYMLPVLGLIYAGSLFYIAKLFKNKAKLHTLVLTATIIVFFISALPTYISRANPEWHNTRASGFNQTVRRTIYLIYPF